MQVRDTCLYTGDQLSFDRNRFLVEAPGLPQRPKTDPPSGPRPAVEVTQTFQQIRIDPVQHPAPGAAGAPAGNGDSPEQPANGGVPPWVLMVIGAALVVVVVLVLNAR